MCPVESHDSGRRRSRRLLRPSLHAMTGWRRGSRLCSRGIAAAKRHTHVKSKAKTLQRCCTCSDLSFDGVDDVKQQQITRRQAHWHNFIVVLSPVASQNGVQRGGHDTSVSDFLFAAGKDCCDCWYGVQALHHSLPEIRCGGLRAPVINCAHSGCWSACSGRASYLSVAVELRADVDGGDEHGAAVAAQAARPLHNFISVQSRSTTVRVTVVT